MDKKNILPQQGKPVIRMTAGKLPSRLAELSEEALGGSGVDASCVPVPPFICSYDGVDASSISLPSAPPICSYDGVDASSISLPSAPPICSYDD